MSAHGLDSRDIRTAAHTLRPYSKVPVSPQSDTRRYYYLAQRQELRPDPPRHTTISRQTNAQQNHLRRTGRLAAHLRLFLRVRFGEWKVQTVNARLQAKI